MKNLILLVIALIAGCLSAIANPARIPPNLHFQGGLENVPKVSALKFESIVPAEDVGINAMNPADAIKGLIFERNSRSTAKYETNHGNNSRHNFLREQPSFVKLE